MDMPAQPKRRTIPVTTILIAIMAVAGGIAISPYLLSLNQPSSPLAVTTVPTTVTTTVESVQITPTSSSLLYTSSTSTSQKPKWIGPDTNVISWKDAGKYGGQTRTVEGTIVYTFTSSKGNVFLDFRYPYQGYFYAVIFSSDVRNFAFNPASFYLNKEVRITGPIQLYQGSPEIIVHSPSQIEVAYMGFNYP